VATADSDLLSAWGHVDRLMMNYPGNPITMSMFAESRTRFFMTTGDGAIEFSTNAEGRITTLMIHSNVPDQVAVRRTP
jgi:hypothetical protein